MENVMVQRPRNLCLVDGWLGLSMKCRTPLILDIRWYASSKYGSASCKYLLKHCELKDYAIDIQLK